MASDKVYIVKKDSSGNYVRIYPVAHKLTTATAGSATKPVYFKDGIPVACSNSFNVITISKLTDLSSKANGWYKFSGTISDVSGTWTITKAGTLYTATNMEDPRVLLSSTDLSNWYSPYAYWHA